MPCPEEGRVIDKPADKPLEKPASYEALLEQITPEIHQQLRRATELGKWPDGQRLTPEQIERCLEAVIVWEQRNLPEEERTGYIDRSGLDKGPRGNKH